MKIKKNDKVKILQGKDSGKTGNVDRVFEKQGKVLVGGLNLYKKHLKPRGEGQKSQGGIVDLGRPILVSKVSLICPKCGKETRVKYQKEGEGKIRVCSKCKAQI
jgi:large subunit ribosomal protein L24